MNASNHPNFFKKLVFVFALFIFSFSIIGRPAQAIKVVPPWQFAIDIYDFGANSTRYLHNTVDNIKDALDITKTVNHILATILEWPVTWILQVDAGKATNCGMVYLDSKTSATAKLIEGGLDPADAANVVAGAQAQVADYDPSVCEFQDNTHLADAHSGSLASITLKLHESASTEPLPVNMASYFKDYARRIPLVKDTAYAQTSYPVVGIELILELWKQARNVSYGIISIVMLVVGIMIMTRHKANPQVAVTVQNALPRVVISIILITFSYPIGATLISLTVPLIAMTHTIFFSTAASELANMNAAVALFSLITGIYGFGIFGLIMGLIVLMFSVLLWFIALIRVTLIQIRLLLAIIVAPLQFAMGAIPGKEDQTMKWFKNTIAHVLSMPAMFFMIMLAWYILYKALFLDAFSNMTTDTDPATAVMSFVRGSIVSRQFTMLFAPIMMIFCLASSLKMPGMVQNWILGPKAKR